MQFDPFINGDGLEAVSLFCKQAAVKKKLLQSDADTFHGMKWELFKIRVGNRFEQIKYFRYGKQEEAILAQSQYGLLWGESCLGSLHFAHFYFNWTPIQSNHANIINKSKGYWRDNVWVGDYDAREGLFWFIDSLAADGMFMPFQHRPPMRLLFNKEEGLNIEEKHKLVQERLRLLK